MKILFLATVSLAIAAPAWAGTLELSSPIEQGALVRGVTEPGAHVSLDGHAIRVAPDGHFIFGFAREAAAKASLDVTFKDGTKEHRDLAVAVHPYDIQKIEGLPPKVVTPDPETIERIKHDQAAVGAAHHVDSSLMNFEEPLQWPAVGRISGVYGSQRILNGQPRAPHMGTDVAVPIGTPVHAAAGGTVSLAEPDFVLDGGIVIVDHGYGLSTLFMHMSKIDVKPGDKVTSGQVLGLSGMTGRATGPHIHWGVNWYGTALDPVLAAVPQPTE